MRMKKLLIDTLLILMVCVSETLQLRRSYPHPSRRTFSNTLQSKHGNISRGEFVAWFRGEHLRKQKLLGETKQKTRETCRRHSIQMQITATDYSKAERPTLCQNNYVYVYSCRGGCHSYSQVDKEDYRRINHGCSCCKAVETVNIPVKVACTDGKTRVAYVSSARKCTCRPCDAVKGPDAIQFVKDLIDKRRRPWQ